MLRFAPGARYLRAHGTMPDSPLHMTEVSAINLDNEPSDESVARPGFSPETPSEGPISCPQG